MALEPVSGEPDSVALLSLSLLVYMGHQGLFCANLCEIVEKANALNAEVAEVARRAPRVAR
jgi:hypothetical protein